MAAPVAHIICAFALLNSGMIDVDDTKAFLIGTSFPDIRYIADIERKTTHRRVIEWQDVVEATKISSFKAGMLLHSLVDRVHDNYMKKHTLFDHLPPFEYRYHTFKFIADTIIYDWRTDWQLTADMFDEILPEEREFSIAEEKINQWHKIIKEYCSQGPTVDQMLDAVFRKELHIKHVQKIDPQIEPFIRNIITENVDNQELKSDIISFYNNIVPLLTSDEYN